VPAVKAWLSQDDQNFPVSLGVILSPNLRKQQGDFWEDQMIGPGTMAGNSSLEGRPACQPKMCYSGTTQELRTDDGENADVLLTEINDRCSKLCV